MDFLKAEIAAKKRKQNDVNEIEDAAASSSRAGEAAQTDDAARNKYERRSELEKRRRVGHDDAGAARNSAALRKGKDDEQYVAPVPSDGDIEAKQKDSAGEQETQAFSISNEEAIRRLRAKGEPIRLFDESDKDRRLRLRALELIEQRGESMGQNDFLRAMRGAESNMLDRGLAATRKDDGGAAGTSKSGASGTAEEALATEQLASGTGADREGVGMDSLLDLSLIKRDINKVYPIIYYTLKGLLRGWEQALAERPADVRQSNQGKLVAATQVQTAEYLKPLFKQLRRRSVKPDVLARLAEIVHYVQKREYRHANDSYLQLSIGNAPWPIGVTMVGIHERSGREKIFSSNVAHVLNDEVSRKYIQSLKRLMTFAQTKYPPANVSMLMG